MKKTILIVSLLTLVLGSAVVQAQQGSGNGNGNGAGGQSNAMNGGGNGGPGNQVDRLVEKLGLDELQAAEVAAIFEEAQLLRDQERENSRLANCDIRANVQAQVEAVLTAEQSALHAELKQQREELWQALEDMRQARGGNGRGQGQGGMLNCEG